MFKLLTIAAALAAVPALAQMPAASSGPTPYAPAGAMPAPGTTPSGLGRAMSPGSPVSPALPQPSTGVTPPIGAATAGTTGDGRVGTLAPSSATPPPAAPQ